MRKKGLTALAFIFVLIVILNLIFTDRFFEKRLESVLTGIVGAKVEFDNFYVSFLALEAGWSSLRITDPNNTWENLIETDKARLDIEVTPLFYGRYVINEITLEGVRSGTKRETDGRLPESVKPRSAVPGLIEETADYLTSKLERNSGLDLNSLKGNIDINSVVEAFDLQAPQKFNSFRDQITTISSGWKETWNTYPELKTKSEEIISKAGEINIDGLRQVTDFAAAANTLKQLRDETKALIDQIVKTKKQFAYDHRFLTEGFVSIDKWIADDISSAKANAKLPDINTENITGILFGSQIIAKIEKAKKYYAIAHEYGSRLFPPNKVESPPRFQGQDIKFRNTKEWPLVWIKNISLSGETGIPDDKNSISLSGKITDLATDQSTTGKPTMIQLTGGKVSGEKIGLSAILDHTGENPVEDFIVNFTGMKLNSIQLSENSLLPGSVSGGLLDVSTGLKIGDGMVEGSLKAIANSVDFAFSEQASQDRITGIIQNVFKGLNSLDIDLGFSGQPDNIDLTMTSNVDNLFVSRLRSVAGNELLKARADLDRNIRERIEPAKKRFLTFYNDKLGSLNSMITQLDALSVSNNKLIESKRQELEKRIDSERNPILRQALRAVKQIIKW